MAIEQNSTTDNFTTHLLKQFSNYKEYRKSNYDYKFAENYRLYKSYRGQKPYIWQTNVFVGYVFTMIETILPRIVQALWQGDRFVTAHPREETDVENAKIIDDLMQYQIDTDITNLFIEMVRFFKTCLIQGTGIGKLTWDVLKDKPSFVNKDVLDFYPQPYKKNIADMNGVFDAFDIPVDILMER